MRRTLLVLAILLLARAAPALAEETWYVEQVTRGDVPLRVEHMWSKGARFHSHTVVSGQPIVTLVSGEWYYTLDPLRMVGIAVRRLPAAVAADASRGRPMAREAERLIGAGAERTGTEELGGRPCDSYSRTDARGRWRVWMTQKEPRLPVRVELFSREKGQTVVSDYVEWLQGFEIPDAYFEPDPRFQVERLEYATYLERASKGPALPLPILYADLLHGEK
jgi:hypothetical protein